MPHWSLSGNKSTVRGYKNNKEKKNKTKNLKVHHWQKISSSLLKYDFWAHVWKLSVMVLYLTSVWNITASLLLLWDISQNKPSQIRGIKPLSCWHIRKETKWYRRFKMTIMLLLCSFNLGVVLCNAVPWPQLSICKVCWITQTAHPDIELLKHKSNSSLSYMPPCFNYKVTDSKH